MSRYNPAGLAATSAWGVFVSIGLSLVGKSKNINNVVARSFYYLCGPLCGIRFTVEGEQYLEEAQYKPAVLLGNHQTMVDILCTFPHLDYYRTVLGS